MKVSTCKKKCCLIYQQPYDIQTPYVKKRFRAGVLIYDSTAKKVLLVQSRGMYWGPPKGGDNIGELPHQCAIREVYEETGISLKQEELTSPLFVRGRNLMSGSRLYGSNYFYCEKPIQKIKLQNNEDNEANDANGITWINPQCLIECIKDGMMVVNNHCRMLVSKFFDVYLPYREEVINSPVLNQIEEKISIIKEENIVLPKIEEQPVEEILNYDNSYLDEDSCENDDDYSDDEYGEQEDDYYHRHR